MNKAGLLFEEKVGEGSLEKEKQGNEWAKDKETLKHLSDILQEMSQQFGGPILLSVHPKGSKCVALYNQSDQSTEVDGQYCFMKIVK